MTATSRRAICCVVGWWPGPNDSTGIFIREHVQAIALYRPVVVIYMEVLKKGWLNFGITSRVAVEQGIEVHHVRITTPLRRAGIAEALMRRAYRSFFRKQTRKFDLIHIHVRTEVTEQVMPMARELDLPVVLTEHNSFYHTGIHRLPVSQQRHQQIAIRKWLSDPRIRKVMPVSNNLAGVLHGAFGVSNDKITVVPNVAADVFRPGGERSSPPVQLLLAALWRPPKDPDVFIDALATLSPDIARQLCIHWVGYGPFMPRIMERCRTELPQLEIHFTGRLEKTELAVLMQRAHVFILPTTAENLPCVILESLCCGTPVISMAVNGIPEMIDRSNGILVSPNNPVELAEALVSCIIGTSHFDHDAIARNALARYSKEVIGAELEEVYQALIHGSQDR